MMKPDVGFTDDLNQQDNKNVDSFLMASLNCIITVDSVELGLSKTPKCCGWWVVVHLCLVTYLTSKIKPYISDLIEF